MFPPPRITHNDLLKTCSIVMSTAVINRKITGYFEMPTARMRQDFGMWLQLTNKGHWALGLDKILVEIGYGHQSVSSNKFLAAFYHWKTVRKYSNISFLVMSVYFFSYAINGIRTMPAKGGNAALSDEEVAAAVVHMVNASGGSF